MFIPLFGISIPLPELIVIFSIVVVIYLIIYDLEFKQIKGIIKKVDQEEAQLINTMKELTGEITILRNAMAGVREGGR